MDATLKETESDLSQYYLDPIVLPKLGEAKPGAVEFYTELAYEQWEREEWKNSCGYWTYDYKCVKKPNSRDRIVLNVEERQPALRGRKFYWHSETWKKCRDRTFNNSKMRRRICPLAAVQGKPLFEFRVYFENLALQDMQKLCWALDFNDKNCAQKIGGVRPLGFGRVRIGIEEAVMRRIDKETGGRKTDLIWKTSRENIRKIYQSL